MKSTVQKQSVQEPSHTRLSAAELRKLPKADRDRIMNAQFEAAAVYYKEHQDSVAPVGQDAIDDRKKFSLFK